ncbi:MAG: DUF3788 family protein [Bacteroidales bacterium]
MEKSPLNDPDVYPEKEVLAEVLGTTNPVYEEFSAKVSAEPLMLSSEWRYYRDGHAWLCRVSYNKKTIFWLSVWEGYFKTTFYFTEKTGAGISDLGISNDLVEQFKNNPLIGKLKPITITVRHKEQLDDIYKVAAFKKKLK